MFDVKHIAKLARLGLADEELRKIDKDLSSILAYFNELKEVDVSGVKPTSHPRCLENFMRYDIARKQSPEIVDLLIKSAPSVRGRYIKVKSIL